MKNKFIAFTACFMVLFYSFGLLAPQIAFAFDQGWWDSGGTPIGNPMTITGGPNNTQTPPPPGCAPTVGKPISLNNGQENYQCVDLYIPGRSLDVTITHQYYSGSNFSGQFGFGWMMNYYVRLKVLASGNVAIVRDMRQDTFTLSGGVYAPPVGVYETLVQQVDGSWILTKAQGEQWLFNVNGTLSAIRDRNGNQITLTYEILGGLMWAAPVTGVALFSVTGTRTTLALDYRLSKITDTLGRDINFSYNADGKLITITDFNGRSVKFAYNSVDDLLSITLPASAQYPIGLVKSFTYDSNHNVTKFTDPKGQVFASNYYDASQRVIKQDIGTGSILFDYSIANRTTVTDPKGFVVRYDMDANGNLTRKEEFTKGVRAGDPASYITQYTGNGNMELASITYPKGNGIKYIYDTGNANPRARGNLLQIRYKASMAASDNNTNDILVSATYENLFNQIKTVTDPKGNVITLTYDYQLPTSDPHYNTKGNLVDIASPMISGQTPFVHLTYNAYGQVTSVQDPNGLLTNLNYYSTDGQLQSIIRDPAGINAITAITYDSFGTPDTIVDPLGHTTTLNFNALGWLIQETNPLGRLTKYTYDQNGNAIKIERQANASATLWQTTQMTYTMLNDVLTMTDPLGNVTTYNYDLNQNIASVVDAEGRATTYQFDERNLLYKALDANTPQGTTEYGYDLNGNVATIKDANANVTTYAYDLFDRQQKITYPDTKFTLFTFDKNSNITNKQTPALQSITYAYDPLNRLIAKNFPANTVLNTAYTYDLGSRLLTANNTAAALTFTYDNLNRVLTNAMTVPVATWNQSYVYDKVGNRTRVVYPSGKAIDFTYTANGNMQGISVNGAALSQYVYDPLDRRVGRSFLTAPAQAASYAYDLADQLSSINNQVTGAPSPISKFDYTLYDKVGNRKALQLTRGLASVSTTYNYNAIYELTSVAGAQVHAFQYDNVNNRKTVDGLSYTANNLNQYTIVGAQAYQYDLNGNLKDDGKNAYTYDEANRLATMTNAANTASYEYDGFNRRVSKTVNGVKTYLISDWDNEIEERTAAGVLSADYVYGDNIDEVLTMTRGGSTYYYHYDGLGSVTDLTSATGTTVERYDYDVYGQPTIRDAGGTTIATSAVGNPFLFTGRRLDTESSIYTYRARMYDPTIGRFLQRDPVGYYDSMNLMQYTGNNPVNWIDPSGEMCLLPTKDELKKAGKGWLDEGFWKDPLIAAALAFGATFFTRIGYKGGEITITKPGAKTPDWRFNPFGSRGSQNPYGRRPHYHRRPGIEKHRPWERGW